MMKLRVIAIIATLTIPNICLSETIMKVQSIDPLSTNFENILSPGRTIMRRHESLLGTTVHSSSETSVLYFTESLNDGHSWNLEKIATIHGETPSTLFNPSLDSNQYGKYMAFSTPSKNGVIGHIAYKPIDGKAFVIANGSNGMTPKSNTVTKSFIAASRGQDEYGNYHRDVGYGWVDEKSGDIFIGHSDNGIDFHPAKRVYTDPYLIGGVSVATSGDFVVVIFHSLDKKYKPKGLKKQASAYPVWMESNDGGDTWSTPSPLFGLSIDDFPLLSKDEQISTAGGMKNIVVVANALAWERVNKGQKNIYVTSALQPVQQSKTGKWKTLKGKGKADISHIGVVSVRDFNVKNGGWKHIVSQYFPSLTIKQEKISEGPVEKTFSNVFDSNIKSSDILSSNTSFYQYSALPDTSFRTLTYLESTNDRTPVNSLVVAISIDSGKSYSQFVKTPLSKLGILSTDVSNVYLAVSQCLFGDPGGNVYIDAMIAEKDTREGLMHIKIPLGLKKDTKH